MRSKTKRDLKQQQKGPNINFIDPFFLWSKYFVVTRTRSRGIADLKKLLE